MPTVVPIPSPRPVDRPAIIDEYGRLSSKLSSLAAMQRRHEQLRKMIVSWYADTDAEVPYDEDGDRYSIHLSPRAMERKIVNMTEVAERIGLDKFFTLCTLSLEKLDACIPLAHQHGLTLTDRTGPRTLKPVQKFTGAA